ncbi:hypothetical protein BC936DRAFT_140182 [Jimgerdemannia flammicorona]|uniref:MACPF domain-containing protein n=1 Tax=Jimgerdemannia flammicorona TaxID=994334 RepID=A0A433AXP0_9FUNG|nr:hypothetical protein BC936DRAFT_140182 [Jimgerdemannia flammicorona]
MFGRRMSFWHLMTIILNTSTVMLPFPTRAGGRITVSEIITEHQSDREKKTKALADAKASVSGTITGFGKAGFSAGFTTQANRGATNAADFSNQRSRLRIIGGRPTSHTLEDRTSWQESLDLEPSTWEVILREELIPIYELLDYDLLAQVKEVMEASLNEERITTEMKLNLRNFETKFSCKYACSGPSWMDLTHGLIHYRAKYPADLPIFLF